MTDPAASPHPTAERYLASLDRELAAMPRAERSEVVDEIRAHLHDATAAGQPLGEVLSRLGPAEALAKAYLVESYLNPRPAGLGPLTRTFGLVGLVVFGSFPTLLPLDSLLCCRVRCCWPRASAAFSGSPSNQPCRLI
jgi:hypothetical protein